MNPKQTEYRMDSIGTGKVVVCSCDHNTGTSDSLYIKSEEVSHTCATTSFSKKKKNTVNDEK